MDTRLDYRISCLLSIFRREFDDSNKSSKASTPSTPTTSNLPTPDSLEKRIDLDEIAVQAEAIFDTSSEDDLNLVLIPNSYKNISIN